MRLRLFIAFAMLLLAGRANAMELPELAAFAKPSVVLVRIYDAGGRLAGSGSGFIASADGRVVTNEHVIDGATRATVTTADGKETSVLGVLAEDKERDIAIVKLAGEGFTPLSLGDSGKLRVGEEIVVIGSPLGLSQSMSTGVVAALRREGPVREEERAMLQNDVRSWGIQITAPVSHGSSGSPVLTRDGEVVAVAVGIMAQGQNVNFGVPIEVAKELLARVPAGAAPKPFAVETSHRTQNLIISGAVFGVIGLLVWFFRRRERNPAPPRSWRRAS